MPNKIKSLNIFATLRDLFYGYSEHVANLLQLARLETKLACRTLLHLVIVFYFLSFLLTATWFTLLAILFFALLSLQHSALLAACLILVLNLCLIMALIVYVLKIKSHLTFKATRRQLTYQKEPKYDGR